MAENKNQSTEVNGNTDASKTTGLFRKIVAKLSSSGKSFAISAAVVCSTWGNPLADNETRNRSAELLSTTIDAIGAKIKAQVDSHSSDPVKRENAVELLNIEKINNKLLKVVPEMLGLTLEEISDIVLDARQAEINERQGKYNAPAEQEQAPKTMAEQLRVAKKRASGDERQENVKGAILDTIEFFIDTLAPVVAGVLTPITLFAAINKACVYDPGFEREKRLMDKGYREKAKNFSERYQKFCELVEEKKAKLVELLKDKNGAKKVDARVREIIIECAKKADLELSNVNIKTAPVAKQEAQSVMA